MVLCSTQRASEKEKKKERASEREDNLWVGRPDREYPSNPSARFTVMESLVESLAK